MEGALEASVVARETVELFLQHLIVQDFGVSAFARAGFRLHLADAAELPGGTDDFSVEGVFDCCSGHEL